MCILLYENKCILDISNQGQHRLQTGTDFILSIQSMYFRSILFMYKLLCARFRSSSSQCLSQQRRDLFSALVDLFLSPNLSVTFLRPVIINAYGGIYS